MKVDRKRATKLEISPATVDAAHQALSHWWSENARDLPWRFGRTSAWGILVCEVMSQQTQMSRVVPYWLTWMSMWEDARSLARASAAEVLSAWGRLGYPKRALRLQACARVVAERYNNEVPHTYEELVSLPGVGDYTACAVLSFAYGEPVAVLDTNIRRVLSRVFLSIESLGGTAGRVERELSQLVLPTDSVNLQSSSSVASSSVASSSVVSSPESFRPTCSTSSHVTSSCTPAIWNQAIMELGALICTASKPRCDACPLIAQCGFRAAGYPSLGERRTRPRQQFVGTNRQVRGIILQALRDQLKKSPSTSSNAVAVRLSQDRLKALWKDHDQVMQCVDTLVADGLIVRHEDQTISLPC